MKLPHWAYLVLALTSLVVGQLLAWQQSGTVALAGWIVTALAALKVPLALFTDSVQTSAASKRALAAASSRAAGLALFALAALPIVACSGCSGAQQQNAVNAGVSLAACVLATVSEDVAAGRPWSTCVADAVSQCGADAVTVATVWADHVHAEVVEGFVPKMPAPDAGVAQ